MTWGRHVAVLRTFLNVAARGGVTSTAARLTTANLTGRMTMDDVECTQNAPTNIEAIAPESQISSTGPHPVRHLTVAEGFGRAWVPWLRIQGKWLERAGFEIGDKVRVEVGVRRLVIEVEQKFEWNDPDI